MTFVLPWPLDKVVERGLELAGGRRPLAERVEASRVAFKRVRKYLKDHEPQIVERCKEYYRARHPEWFAEDDRHCFLYGPDWLQREPMALDRIELRFDPAARIPTSDLRLLRRWWPMADDGRRLETYHDAIELYDRPALWFGGASYRLLRFERAAGGRIALDFGRMGYFDGIDSCAALGFEAAATSMGRGAGRGVDRRTVRSFPGPYRRRLKDPFDLEARACYCNVSALTIRRSDRGCTFYLQHRTGVEGLQGRLGCLPAGEFQPSGPYAYREDLDVWKCLMREYAEELLGLPEPVEQDGMPIDYEHEDPYRSLLAAYRDGSVRVHVLDIGMDPVTLKAGIWVACVFEAAAFDEIFKDMASATIEGRVLGQWPFTETQIGDICSDDRLTQGARLVLSLAWKHRDALGLNVSA